MIEIISVEPFGLSVEPPNRLALSRLIKNTGDRIPGQFGLQVGVERQRTDGHAIVSRLMF